MHTSGLGAVGATNYTRVSLASFPRSHRNPRLPARTRVGLYARAFRPSYGENITQTLARRRERALRELHARNGQGVRTTAIARVGEPSRLKRDGGFHCRRGRRPDNAAQDRQAETEERLVTRVANRGCCSCEQSDAIATLGVWVPGLLDPTFPYGPTIFS